MSLTGCRLLVRRSRTPLLRKSGPSVYHVISGHRALSQVCSFLPLYKLKVNHDISWGCSTPAVWRFVHLVRSWKHPTRWPRVPRSRSHRSRYFQYFYAALASFSPEWLRLWKCWYQPTSIRCDSTGGRSLRITMKKRSLQSSHRQDFVLKGIRLMGSCILSIDELPIIALLATSGDQIAPRRTKNEIKTRCA